MFVPHRKHGILPLVTDIASLFMFPVAFCVHKRGIFHRVPCGTVPLLDNVYVTLFPLGEFPWSHRVWHKTKKFIFKAECLRLPWRTLTDLWKHECAQKCSVALLVSWRGFPLRPFRVYLEMNQGQIRASHDGDCCRFPLVGRLHLEVWGVEINIIIKTKKTQWGLRFPET
jgi:hypothetical protein